MRDIFGTDLLSCSASASEGASSLHMSNIETCPISLSLRAAEAAVIAFGSASNRAARWQPRHSSAPQRMSDSIAFLLTALSCRSRKSENVL